MIDKSKLFILFKIIHDNHGHYEEIDQVMMDFYIADNKLLQENIPL